MARFIAVRFTSFVAVLIVVCVVTFSLIVIAPGDPAQIILGEDATAEDLARIRKQLGLDQPVYIQFIRWVGQVLQGDLGRSIYYGEPVTTLISQRLESSLHLSVFGTTFAAAIGIPLGVIAATRRGRIVDRLVMVSSVLGMSIPAFWLALNLILVFSIWLRVTPVSGYPGLADDPWGSFKSILLPAISIGTAQAAWLARVTRSELVEVLAQDYIRSARAKGLRENTVLFSHALRNALLPVVTVIGFIAMSTFSSAVVIEEVFALPGLGRLATTSVLRRDYPVIQGIVLIIAVAFAVINLVIDLLYVWLDPRVKY